jgi:glycosyltransferase involved in cell wall biosynthesis
MMVLPSWSEGSPNVLLEAMAAGLPIVATAVGGVPEIAAGSNSALLVQKQDPAGLAQAIARVLDDEALRKRLSAAARATAAGYSPQTYLNSMVSLYHECITDRAKQAKDSNPKPQKTAPGVQDRFMLTQ